MGQIFRDIKYYNYALVDLLKMHLRSYDGNDEDLDAWVEEHCFWKFSKDQLKQGVNVMIGIETWTNEGFSDSIECNPVNLYAHDEIQEISHIKWLAAQQGYIEELDSAVKALSASAYKSDEYSPFTKSVLSVLENVDHRWNSFVFLTKIPLSDFLKIEHGMYIEFGREAVINISKNTRCGLLELYWGHSHCGLKMLFKELLKGEEPLLGITLEKDVRIPVKKCDCWIYAHGGLYGDFYGALGENFWEGTFQIEDAK